MLLTYLAGPFTAPTPWGIERNIRRAEEAAEDIIRARDDVALIVPHSLGRCFVGRAGTPEYWYAATMRMMESCDAIVMLDGWHESVGSRAEFRRAHGLGLSIYGTEFDFAHRAPPLGDEAIHRIMETLADPMEPK